MNRIKTIIVTLAMALLWPIIASGHGGPGLYQTPLIGGRIAEPIGTLNVWNSPERMLLQFEAMSPWKIMGWQIYVGSDSVPTKRGKPIPGHFPYKFEPEQPAGLQTLSLDLRDDLGFSWGSSNRVQNAAIHVSMAIFDDNGKITREEGAWAGPLTFSEPSFAKWFQYELHHPKRGRFIDAPVHGLTYDTPTAEGVTGEDGGFLFFPNEQVHLAIGNINIGSATAAKIISPVDLFTAGSLEDPRVWNVAWLLQSLDASTNPGAGAIIIPPEAGGCIEGVIGDEPLDFANDAQIVDVVAQCGNTEVSLADAVARMETALNLSGIFRKNITKTEDYGESKQKLDVMPVYLPALRADGSPSFCDLNANGVYDEGTDTIGVPYEEWRLNGDPDGEKCNVEVDGDACVVTLIECRDKAKPVVVTYKEKIDLSESTIDFDVCGDPLTDDCRFSNDIYTAISRDDGTTWKRMNVSRMADLSSFDLETDEPFPGTCSSPYLKINDNKVLVVWESKFCRSGTPRYSINVCEEMNYDVDGDGIADSCEICRDTAQGPICEPDYTGDDPYAVMDIWGVRGSQKSVNYDEVDDVDELGIGEIPYSCLWAARGLILTAEDTDKFAYLTDDPDTAEVEAPQVGEILWFKPERLTSGRRDVFFPVVGSARGAGFGIAWQEDPSGLRPGKGKGPGQGWSGAISNHKTDIWYSFITYEDFDRVDTGFISSGPGDDPNGTGPNDDRPGIGRPKALVPFSLPVRISDNAMINTDSLKVELGSNCVTPPNGTDPVCFPEVDPTTGTFTPLNSDEIAREFCGHPEADPATCCDPENHEGDPNCEDLKGLYGNLTGTKRYGYMARSIDNYNNETLEAPGDGIPDYQYYVDRGGTLDLCDISGDNSYIDILPGTAAHERWYGFTNAALDSKLVCVSADGRMLDGDVSASRPNIQMQPYTKTDGTKSAWVLLAYEESKGMGHSLAASEHDNPVDETIDENSGQEKPIKQDLGKNLIYHTFDFSEPDLVDPGHIVNLPALCGGLFPNYCGDEYTGTNPTCTCEPGQPVPLYFDYFDGTEWMPDETKFMQYRTEIARRARFIMQSGSKAKKSSTGTLGAIIYKQGQEGQGRPADVFIRRMVLPEVFNPKVDNPFAFENFECNEYLDQHGFTTLKPCPNDGTIGYNCNVWGEGYGDRLCGGIFADPVGGFDRRDHINLTSADIDMSVPVGPLRDDGGTPDDPTDDVYARDKVLLWTQHDYNLGNESYGTTVEEACTDACPGMYSNARSHRGFIRGDFLVGAYAYSPNWAAGRNGNDRYNFYVRRSFDGGQTWTTTPATMGGEGVSYCREWRSDPTTPDDDGTGNAPPTYIGFDPECVDWCPPCPEGEICECTVTGEAIGAGEFEPARNVSQIANNKETSSDPRVGATPPTYPLDGTEVGLPNLCPTGPASCEYVEDEYVNNVFLVAWGTGDNVKSTGGTTVTPEAAPLDLYYTRSEDYGDTYYKVPWVVNGDSSNFYGETVWRYERLAWGEEEQGECQLRATPDGSKMYGIYHQLTPVEGDPDEPLTRWYPWEPEESHENDLWFRRVIFPENYNTEP